MFAFLFYFVVVVVVVVVVVLFCFYCFIQNILFVIKLCIYFCIINSFIILHILQNLSPILRVKRYRPDIFNNHNLVMNTSVFSIIDIYQ